MWYFLFDHYVGIEFELGVEFWNRTRKNSFRYAIGFHSFIWKLEFACFYLWIVTYCQKYFCICHLEVVCQLLIEVQIKVDFAHDVEFEFDFEFGLKFDLTCESEMNLYPNSSLNYTNWKEWVFIMNSTFNLKDSLNFQCAYAYHYKCVLEHVYHQKLEHV